MPRSQTLIVECVDRHAPLKRVKITRPPAPWLHAPDIRQLQAERDKLRLEAHNKNNDVSWAAFRTTRNKIKVVTGKAKRSFFLNALSSKRPKEVWRVIHRVLNPSTSPLRADPDQLNKYFIATNERTLGTSPDVTSDLLELARSLPEHPNVQRSFKLCHVTFAEVMKELRQLRSDCSTGVDQIPVKFVKLVSEQLAGPLTHIINTCITSSTFPRIWKTVRLTPIPKTDHPQNEKDFLPVSILPALSKVFERLVLKQN